MQIDSKKQIIAQNELDPEEKLLWIGEPNPIRMVVSMLHIFAFCLPFTAFAIFFMWKEITSAGELRPDNMFFLLFIMLGLGGTALPFLGFFVARKTIYVITTRRVLVITEARTRRVASYSDEDIGHIERNERADGSGNLTFAQRIKTNRKGRQYIEKIELIGIPNVRTVENLLRTTFKKNGI